jgi:hypothetical protein
MGNSMSTKLKAGTSTIGAVLDADTTGILELQSGSTPTTALTVDASQNVGIGTNSPAAKLDVNGSIFPTSDNSTDLGSSSKRWRNVYTADLVLSNKDSQNDIDGTWGNWVIQEGENDLFLINKRNNKKYKFNLTEVK